MAQLKDLIVNGASRFIGDIFGNKAQLTTLEVPKTSGGTEYGPGTSGQVLKSNGTSLYWASDNNSDTNVTQTITSTTNSDYRVLFSGTADDTTRTEGARKDTDFKWNPNTNTLTAENVAGNASSATKAKVTSTTLPSSGTNTYYLTYAGSTTTGNQDLKNSARTYIYENTTATYLNVGSASTTGGLTLHEGNSFYGNLVTDTLTANRTYTLPNATGTIALTSSSITGNATTATRANITTNTNGVAYYTNTTGAFGNIRAASGAFYSTGQDVKPTFGTLPIAQGGTGKTTWEINRITYASATNTLGQLAHASSTSYLLTSGSESKEPSWIQYSNVASNDTIVQRRDDGFISSKGFAVYEDNPNHLWALIDGGIWEDAPSDYWVIELGSPHKFYGNADTATTLQTARTINGTSFNGSANITTTNWGTARNISISDSDATNTGTAVSVNGSAAVTLKLPATIKASLSGNATTATRANITTTANAVAYYTNTTGTFGTKASANGALYATSANGTLQWGTLPIAQGGTAATTAFEAINNLGGPSLNNYTIIAQSTSVDTLTTPGTYAASSLANAQSLTGGPMDNAFKLFTLYNYTSNYINHIALPRNGIPNFYSRLKPNGAWGRWYRTAMIASTNETLTDKATWAAIGSTTQPVYVNTDGVITAITGTINNNAKTATGANTTTTTNALAYYTNTTGTFGDSAITITKTSKHIAGFINGGQLSGSTLGTQATAEGNDTTASGNFSHAEGGVTTASGACSHAEGYKTTAFGHYSHAEGVGTIAYKSSQHVFGEYNIAESTGTAAQKGTYIEIVGNGTAEIDGTNAVRSNARTLDWSGNEWLAGTLTTSKFIHPAITGSGTAAVTTSPYKPALWKFNLGIATPAEGDIITIKIPVAGHTNGVFVSTDDGTTYYPVSVSGTTRLTTHFGANQVISLVFLTSGGTNTVYPVAGGTETTNITGNHWCVLNYYNSDTNTIMRTYAHNTNDEFPLLAGSTTTNTTPLSHTSSYASAYGAIVATTNKRPTINLSTGKITVPGGVTANLTGTATNATNIYSSASTSKAYILGTTTASSANHATVYNASVYTSGSVLYGAAWNDYAEYRQTDSTEPGRCVREVGDDTLILSEKRLERGCEIISDTFGFAIGETENAKTPIAVTGRVLAYPYEDREEFATHIGYPVCSGPNGTVSIMTNEEEEKYPSRIIGFISAVPDYEEWGTGNVKVNGRVWIRIR